MPSGMTLFITIRSSSPSENTSMLQPQPPFSYIDTHAAADHRPGQDAELWLLVPRVDPDGGDGAILVGRAEQQGGRLDAVVGMGPRVAQRPTKAVSLGVRHGEVGRGRELVCRHHAERTGAVPVADVVADRVHAAKSWQIDETGAS